jgi:hypothetical protein
MTAIIETTPKAAEYLIVGSGSPREDDGSSPIESPHSSPRTMLTPVKSDHKKSNRLSKLFPIGDLLSLTTTAGGGSSSGGGGGGGGSLPSASSSGSDVSAGASDSPLERKAFVCIASAMCCW